MNRLQAALDQTPHTEKRFRDELADTALISAGVQEMAAMHKLNSGETFSIVVGSLVALVQSKVPHHEWAETGMFLGESIMRRLTVVQD